MATSAFVPTAIGSPLSRSRTSLTTPFARTSRARLPHRRSARMCEEPLSAAEKTRRALSESEPLVKFRRDPDYLDERTAAAYTNDDKSGLDVWVITGVLTFLVPLVGFAVGVATGFIDINPR